MRIIDKIHKLNLHLFDGAAGGGASGGDGGTGSADGGTGVQAGVPDLQSKGVKNPLSSVQYGKQSAQVQDAQTATEQNVNTDDRNARFEAMIKGEFKDLYDQRMQDTIQKRLKSSKETVDRYNALTPALEMLANKYGVSDMNDVQSLINAIQEDDSYYEDEALEKGLSVEQLKAIKKMERENADLKRQMQEQKNQEETDRIIAGWMDQAQALKTVYPQFDFDTEIQNQRFADLIRNNIDVKTAFEVVHKDEIIPAAMQYTANQVQQKVVNNIRARGNRPVESGSRSSSAALVKSDVSQLTKEDRAEIARRVARGERITF